MELVASDKTPKKGILTAAKGGGITFFGSLVEYAFRFVFSIVLTRSIGAEQFGLYNLALTVVAFAAVFADLGLPHGVVRFVPIFIQERDEDGLWGLLQSTTTLVGVIGLFFAIGLFVLADPLAEQVFHEPSLAPLLRLTSIAGPLTALAPTAVAATRGFKQMHYKVYAQDVAFQTVKLLLTVTLLGLGLGVSGALMAHIIASAVAIGLLFYFLHRLFPLNRPLRSARWDLGSLLRFSLPLYLGQLVGQFGGDIATLLVGVMDTAVSVGIYAVAFRVSAVGSMFLLSISLVAMPIVSELYHQRDYAQLDSLYQTATKWSLSFNLPFFLTVMLFARPLLSIFGSDFGTGAPSLIVLSFGILADAAIGIPGVLLSMTGRSKLHLLNSMVAVITTVVFGLLLIPRWGVFGAAIATASSLFLDNALALVEVFILLRLWPYNRGFVKPLVASLMAAAMTFGVNRWIPAGLSFSFSLVFNIAFLWLSYAMGLMLLGISEEDKLILSTLKARLNSTVRRR
jgi:O-antigen/teichoic acid export membrane protein